MPIISAQILDSVVNGEIVNDSTSKSLNVLIGADDNTVGVDGTGSFDDGAVGFI